MGCVLEAGKLVTASWLYNNWALAPKLLKAYLTSAVVVLMFITSMGIFGFLSKAHIQQTVQLNSGAADQIRIIQAQLDNENAAVADIDKQVAQIDTAISKLTDKGQATTSLRAATQQRNVRDNFTNAKQRHLETISNLNKQKIQLDTQIRQEEVEVGPLKYIAELIYSNANTNQLEKAVRFVIIILVLVFDPLAVILLIAANVGIRANQKPKPILVPPTKAHDVFHIDDNIWKDEEIDEPQRKINKEQHNSPD